MLEGLTHTLFGLCNPKDITSTEGKIKCTKCGGEWFKDHLGKWVDHNEDNDRWDKCLRSWE